MCTDQVHSVSGTGNQTSVRHGKHRVELFERYRSMEVVDRRMVDSTESTIDLSYQLVDTSSQVLVLFHILPGRDSQLDKYDLVISFSST
jgi:hypothetical protein